MKKNSLLSIAFCILFIFPATAQDVLFEFSNPQQSSSGGDDFYEVDVMVSSTAGFKLGSGQLYFDYNPQAFGNSVTGGGRVTITTTGFILGQTSGPFGIYSSFITNDNTPSRVSFSWQQALSSGCIAVDNVGGSAMALFHLQLQYIPGGTAFAPGVCFTSTAPFDDQTFTACGPGASCAFPDCAAEAGIQITNDAFDCANAPLPAELIAFDAERSGESDVWVHWSTASEQQLSHYVVERSADGIDWEDVGETKAVGSSYEISDYQYKDEGGLLAYPLNKAVFYRLRMVDTDAGFEYSPIDVVYPDRRQQESWAVYPNPAAGAFTIFTPDEGYSMLDIYDLNGKKIASHRLDGLRTTITQYGTPLAAGAYLLRLSNSERETAVKRLVITSY